MGRARRFLILDACVLIDFVNAKPESLKLLSQHIGKVHVASNVVHEVEQLRHRDMAALGVLITDPPLDLAARAAAERIPGLSFTDMLCLLLAQTEGWTCVSNDRRLRDACASVGVDVLWGLELLLMLVRVRALTPKAAKDIARLMALSNPYLTQKVLSQFKRRIAKVN